MPLKSLLAAAALLAASATPGLAADCRTHDSAVSWLAPRHLIVSDKIPPAMLDAKKLFAVSTSLLGPTPKPHDVATMEYAELVGNPTGQDGLVEVVGYLIYDKRDCVVTSLIAPTAIMTQILMTLKGSGA